MSVTFAEVTDLAECFAVRRAVFVEEQGFNPAEEFDDHDDTARHILARDGAVAVATARLMVAGDSGRIGRICVMPSHRGLGLGAALVRDAIERLRATPGVQRVVLGAQVRATGFYEKLGFRVCGAEYDDGGVPHHDMDRLL